MNNEFGFELNAKGGWIVPAGYAFLDGTNIPDFSELGNGCALGNWCTLGEECRLGNGCTLGNGCRLGNWCALGNGCRLGNGCALGNWCALGNGCTLGNWCALGNGCALGNWCTLGKECRLDGEKVIYFMTASNIDGSGRQVIFIYNGETVKVRAGCFFGEYKEMIEKAKTEGKEMYYSIVKSISKSILKQFGENK